MNTNYAETTKSTRTSSDEEPIVQPRAQQQPKIAVNVNASTSHSSDNSPIKRFTIDTPCSTIEYDYTSTKRIYDETTSTQEVTHDVNTYESELRNSNKATSNKQKSPHKLRKN